MLTSSYQYLFINHSNDQVAFLLWLSEVAYDIDKPYPQLNNTELGKSLLLQGVVGKPALDLEVDATSSLTATHCKHNPERQQEEEQPAFCILGKQTKNV